MHGLRYCAQQALFGREQRRGNYSQGANLGKSISEKLVIFASDKTKRQTFH